MAEAVESGMFELKRQDINRILKNAAIFAAPALLVFLITLRAGGTLEEAAIALELWAFDVLIDLIRKYIKDNTK